MLMRGPTISVQISPYRYDPELGKKSWTRANEGSAFEFGDKSAA
jgi:hypothetical protein